MANENDTFYGLLGDAPVLQKDTRGHETLEPDALEFDPTAKVLARAAVDTVEPLSIGVFGDWGSGKTSMMKLIRREVSGRGTNVVPVWFDAWEYEKEEHLILPLIAAIRRDLERRVGKNSKTGETSPEEGGSGGKKKPNAFFKRMWLFGEYLDEIQDRISGGEVEVGVPLTVKATTVDAKMKLKWDARKDEESPDNGRYFELLDRIERLPRNVKGAPRIVVFLDDLDRCFPNKAVQLLEQIKLFLHIRGFSFVLGVNEAVIKAYVRSMFVHEFHVEGDYSEYYLDKIVQVKVNVPIREPDHGKMKDYVSRLIKKTGVDFTEKGSTTDDAAQLVAQAARSNPRSVVRMLNRIAVTSRIGELEKREPPLSPLGLLFNFVTEEEKYKEFIESLDFDVTETKRKETGPQER